MEIKIYTCKHSHRNTKQYEPAVDKENEANKKANNSKNKDNTKLRRQLYTNELTCYRFRYTTSKQKRKT
jgi:hypothetical protein